jgi:hypothetical protein
MTKDTHWIHRQAGLATQFGWQDEGKLAQVNSTTILGKLPDQDVWIVEVDGTATDEVADGEYYWPIEAYVAVYRQPNGSAISRAATSREVALCTEEEDEA